MMRRNLASLVVLAALASATLVLTRRATPARGGEGPVRAWEEPLTIPTYPVGPPEPNPMFYAGREYQGAQGPIYPYALQDRLSDEKEDHTWQALWLENDYVRLSVLPEIGGRIFSAEDRTNGYDFFYRQSVIKPALIGMLGAWISGGVEWNVLHHHRATTFMPVQSAIAVNADGSRTIWIGETEWRHRMRWVIGLTLRPGRNVVEQSLRIFNRTPMPQSVLYFANPAVHANEDYQILFPPDVVWTTFHAKTDFSRWPLSDGPYRGVDYAPGTDLSWWKNHPKPISFFVYHSDLDFFGGYDHGRRAGVAHVADHERVPGKKLWEWGNGPDGRAWDTILTDEDGPYIELMAGGYSDNQPDYSWIEPGQARALAQHWYPIRELGGLKAANLEAALDLEVEGQTARIAANATARHDGARVRLTAGERLVSEDTVTIGPDRPFTREVPLPEGMRPDELRLAVLTSDGTELVSYQPTAPVETPEPPRYEPPPPPKQIRSAEELVLAGRRLEQFHNARIAPEPYYREALERDPGYSEAHVALGSLALRRGRFEEAGKHLVKAVARVTANHTRARNGEPQYLYGRALEACGKVDEAREAFAAAAWDRALAGPAGLAQARLEAENGDRDRALTLLERTLAADPQNTAALALQAALLRHAGRADAAFRQATAGLKIDPLDPLIARERALARESGATTEPSADSALDATERAARRSLEQDQYALEAAHDYAKAGLLDDAMAVLEARLPEDRPDAVADPLVAYTLGWLHERRGDTTEAVAWYRRGRELPSAYCFPFRLESIGVLESAMAAHPEDPRAHYYLGNLLYDRQPDRAITEWERARALDPDFARVHRNLAFAYARVRGDLPAAVASQERAVSLEKDEPRLYYELDQLLAWSGAPVAKRLEWLQDRPETVASRDITRARLARVQALAGRPDDALATLAGGHFHVWEGERGIHGVYVQAHLDRGQQKLAAGDPEGALAEFRAAAEVPANIEVGRDAEAHLAAVRFHEGLALDTLGKAEEAQAVFEAAATAPTVVGTDHYWVARSLEKLGREAEARSHFERLVATRPRPHRPDETLPLERRMAAREAQAEAHYRHALGLLGLGRTKEARAALKRAATADPDNVAVAALERSFPVQPGR
jgi:tetratricopeptide (TPR) repeat protein